VWHQSRAHRLFAVARWSSDALGLALADLIVARLLPCESRADPRCGRHPVQASGKKVFGVALHHDGAAKGPKPVGYRRITLTDGPAARGVDRPPATPELRGWVRHRAKLVGLRSNLKCQVHAVLAATGIQVPMSDLFGERGQHLLGPAPLGPESRARVDAPPGAR
jgi:hypothetical protein